MDLLYSRYTNPIEFMNLYINNGQFGEFVEKIIKKENQRKQEEAEKDNEQKLWTLYIHSMTDKSFNDWKNEKLSSNQQQSESLEMSEEQVENVKKHAREILKNFSPN